MPNSPRLMLVLPVRMLLTQGGSAGSGQSEGGKDKGGRPSRSAASKGLLDRKRHRSALHFLSVLPRKMHVAHQRCGLEVAAVLVDPYTQRSSSFVSPGLHGAWGDLEAEEWGHSLLLYNRMLTRFKQHASSTMEGGNRVSGLPVHFRDLPGGRQNQEKATCALLALAVPGPLDVWDLPTETFRAMR